VSSDAAKVTASHLARNAYLYIRQSTLKQVLNNTESTARQYALRQRAAALGWPAGQIITIDVDQGHSGASATDREGFQHLVAEVGLGRAGIVLGLEVSRLARNNADWHRLLGAPRGAAYSCGDGRAPPLGRRSGLVKLEAA
jgi:DNA invertase Pin-like site-specific DNA recombinase